MNKENRLIAGYSLVVLGYAYYFKNYYFLSVISILFAISLFIVNYNEDNIRRFFKSFMTLNIISIIFALVFNNIHILLIWLLTNIHALLSGSLIDKLEDNVSFVKKMVIIISFMGLGSLIMYGYMGLGIYGFINDFGLGLAGLIIPEFSILFIKSNNYSFNFKGLKDYLKQISI